MSETHGIDCLPLCEDCSEGFHGDCSGYSNGLCGCACPDACAGRRRHPDPIGEIEETK